MQYPSRQEANIFLGATDAAQLEAALPAFDEEIAKLNAAELQDLSAEEAKELEYARTVLDLGYHAVDAALKSKQRDWAIGERDAALEERDRTQEQNWDMRATIGELAVDRTTNLLLLNSFSASFERLLESSRLQTLRSLGYVMNLRFLDLNKMRAHNDIGGHDGGDFALGAAGDIVGDLSGSGLDDRILPLPEMVQQIDALIAAGEPIVFNTRYAKGDEVLSIILTPPDKTPNLAEEITRTQQAFEGLYVTYPTSHIYMEGYQMVGYVPFTVKGTAKGNTATVPVTVTFGIIQAPVPLTRGELKAQVKSADDIIMQLKRKRTNIVTVGDGLSLLTTATS